MITNDIRRTKAKLKLFSEEALDWVLFDLIDLIDKDIGDGEPVPDKEKQKMVDKLQKQYLKFLKDNTPENPKQSKLFKDEKANSKDSP